MACACFTRNCPKFLQCQGCSRSILSGMCPVRTNHNHPSPPPFFLELRTLKELRQKIAELRIAKDLAAILGETEIDCKGVSELCEDKFPELGILIKLEGWRVGG